MKIQQISFKSQKQTPSTLLEDFKQGKSIEYEYNTKNDVLMKELDCFCNYLNEIFGIMQL
jgi:hypothetical protein